MLRPTLLLLAVLGVCTAYSSPLRGVADKLSRRSFLIAAPLIAAPAAAMALDMDAFMNKELESTTCDEKVNKKCIPKLSEDEALCRFGSPSKKTGEACIRAGMSTSNKVAGGVDAFGNLDRGDFARCTQYYEDDGGPKYTRKRKCVDSSGKATITVFSD